MPTWLRRVCLKAQMKLSISLVSLVQGIMFESLNFTFITLVQVLPQWVQLTACQDPGGPRGLWVYENTLSMLIRLKSEYGFKNKMDKYF